MEQQEDEGVIRCICGFTEDDGFTIQCETCFVWQHAVCVSITSSTVPDIYFCEQCKPRPLNVEKAISAQTKRLQSELDAKKLKRLEDERELKKLKKQERIDKPSPRKRKDSQDIPKVDKRRRLPTSPPSPQRKRLKDLISPKDKQTLIPKNAKEFDLEESNQSHNAVYERKRGRPRIHSIPESKQGSRNNSPERFIRRKRMPSHESVRHFPANAFESEYAIYAYRFGNSSSNRFTKIALKSLETLLSDISTIPLLQLDQYSSVDTKKEPEDFLVNVPPLITVLEKEWPLSVSTVHHSISPSLNSHHGLFAINCISKGNYISEIKGSICHMKDLDCKYDSLSVNPCLVSPTPNSYVPDGQLVLPPFVFKFPFAKDMDNGLNNLFLDSRFNGNFDGRYVRSYCGGGNESIKSKCNAFLRTVVLIHVSEIETRPKIRNLADSLQLQPKESEMPLLINDRIRLCLIATRNIEFGEEIVLEPSPGVCYFPCICSSAKECLSQRTVEKIEDFRRFHFGDVELSHDSFFDVLQQREDERRVHQEEFEKEQHQYPIWNFEVGESETKDNAGVLEISNIPKDSTELPFLSSSEDSPVLDVDMERPMDNTESNQSLIRIESLDSLNEESNIEHEPENSPEIVIDIEMVEKEVLKFDPEAVEVEESAVELKEEVAIPEPEPQRVNLLDFMMQESSILEGPLIESLITEKPVTHEELIETPSEAVDTSVQKLDSPLLSRQIISSPVLDVQVSSTSLLEPEAVHETEKDIRSPTVNESPIKSFKSQYMPSPIPVAIIEEPQRPGTNPIQALKPTIDTIKPLEDVYESKRDSLDGSRPLPDNRWRDRREFERKGREQREWSPERVYHGNFRESYDESRTGPIRNSFSSRSSDMRGSTRLPSRDSYEQRSAVTRDAYPNRDNLMSGRESFDTRSNHSIGREERTDNHEESLYRHPQTYRHPPPRRDDWPPYGYDNSRDIHRERLPPRSGPVGHHHAAFDRPPSYGYRQDYDRYPPPRDGRGYADDPAWERERRDTRGGRTYRGFPPRDRGRGR